MLKNTMTKVSKSFCLDYLTYITENEPQTFKETMSTLEALLWKEAINDEIESIMKNHTLEPVDLSPSNKPLACKYNFWKDIEDQWSNW